jgi:hypothetical protein
MTDISISNSEIQTWKSCRRRWLLSYYFGYQRTDRAPAGSAILGTRLHAALEGYYGYGLDPVTLIRRFYRDALEQHAEYQDELVKELGLAINILEGYLEWLGETGADADLQVVATELDLTVPLPEVPGVSLRAKLDQRVRRVSDGAVLFLDHKSVANLEKRRALARDEQMKMYQLLLIMAREMGLVPQGTPIMGGIFNMLRKVKRTAKATPPFYHREPFMYNDADMASMRLRLATSCTEIMRARTIMTEATEREMSGQRGAVQLAQQRFLLPTPSLACDWMCAFTEICPMMDDGSAWGEALNGGQFVQGDPYGYYLDNPLTEEIRKEMAV